MFLSSLPGAKRYALRMVDHLSAEKRSWNMSRIRATDTKPEILVRSMLHRAGYRFRKNVKELPDKPDIVLNKYKTVINIPRINTEEGSLATKENKPVAKFAAGARLRCNGAAIYFKHLETKQT
jgi:DNA mismatch endonuclease Vsr